MLTPSPSSPARNRQIVRLLPWLVLCLGLGLTFVLHQNARDSGRKILQDEFSFRVSKVIVSVENRLHGYEQILRGAAGLFAASGAVERGEFREYVRTLKLEQNYPGIQGVGFSRRIAPEEKARHIEKTRNEGFSQYTIHPEGVRDTYTSVVYLEPFSGRNLRAFGFDMYSEPTRRAAMARARDTGNTAISGKVRLLQETDRDIQAGFLMYVPVYSHDGAQETMEQRRANLVGWAYAPFRMNDLMSGLIGKLFSDAREDVDLEIFDGDSTTEETLLYDSDRAYDLPMTFTPAFHAVRIVEIAGRHWTVLVHSLPEFDARLDDDRTRLITFSGIMGSALLTLIVWLLVNGRARALSLAEKMNHELLESEARFRSMANSAPVLIWIAGIDRLCNWFNHSWLEFTGRTMEQETGNGWTEGVHPDDLPRYQGAYNTAFDRRETFRIEYRLKRHDGEYRWVLDSGVPRFDNQGGFTGYIGSCIDISEKKEAEKEIIGYRDHLEEMVRNRTQELVEAMAKIEGVEQRQRIMLEHLPVGVILSTGGVEQKVLYQNSRFVEMFGYTIEEIPTVAQWWPLAYPDAEYRVQVADEWNRRLALAIERQADIETMEANVTAKDGTVKFVRAHTTALGEFNFVTFVDLSDRKQAEEATRSSMEKERLLIQQSRLAAMGEMIGNIAHQWRQPLNALGLLIANIKDAYEYNELDKTYLDREEKNAQRMIQKMSSTIDDFRNFFKPNKEKEYFGLTEAIENTLNLASSGLNNNGIAISVENLPGIQARGFPNEFSQVLLNVITNAKDAILERKISGGRIELSMGSDEKMAWILVKDNAGGIPENILPKIFDPYFTTKEKGTGIGLYMSKMIMDHMDGTIDARNAGDGAGFRLALPRS